jgi:hypothetical protein
MAELTFPITPDGLAVPVWIGLNKPTSQALAAAGRPILAPIQARGLLDTGSNVTVVAPWLLQRLAVSVARTSSTHTVGGQVAVRLYRVSLSVTDPSQPVGAP